MQISRFVVAVIPCLCRCIFEIINRSLSFGAVVSQLCVSLLQALTSLLSSIFQPFSDIIQLFIDVISQLLKVLDHFASLLINIVSHDLGSVRSLVHVCSVSSSGTLTTDYLCTMHLMAVRRF